MAKARTIVAVTEFSSDLRSLPKPGIRAHARIFCMRCGRHHNLHWEEFKNALDIERVTAHRPHHPGAGMKTPTSLQEIIDIYAFKYCDRESDADGYDYRCLDAASPRQLKQAAPAAQFRWFLVSGQLVADGRTIPILTGAHAADLPAGDAGRAEVAERMRRTVAAGSGDPTARWQDLQLIELPIDAKQAPNLA